MSHLLEETLREQADAQTPPHFDVHRIITAGEGRARRTRMASGLAAGVAGVLVAGGLGLALTDAGARDRGTQVAEQVDDERTEQVQQRRFAERRPTYAQGSVIHVGDETIDVGEEIQTFVQTDDGFVFTTADGSVHLTDGTAFWDIGSTHPGPAYLKTDDSGSLVAWVEREPGELPSLVVYDTAEIAEVLRTDEGTTSDMTVFRDAKAAFVYALDDGVVYWHTAEGLVAVDVDTRESDLLLEGGGFDVLDVADGRFAHMTGDSERMHVSDDLSHPGPRMPAGWDGDLSPDARYVASNEGWQTAVFDTRTGREVTPEAHGYDVGYTYAWLDDTRVAMFGGRPTGQDSGTVDILECSVPDGTCEVVAEGVDEVTSAEEGVDLVLPTGERLLEQ